MPFTEVALPLVQPWFEHPEVRNRLGGPEWPARELRLMAGTRAVNSAAGPCSASTPGWRSTATAAASRRCAVAAGFLPDDPGPDGEGIVHHLLRR